MKRNGSGELGNAMRLFSGRMSTAISKYPTGRYGLVGSIPYDLTVEQRHGTPQIPPARKSMSWDTEQDAINALLAIGITHFQLNDCSWYDAKRCHFGECGQAGCSGCGVVLS